MNYELCKKLKDLGFPQKRHYDTVDLLPEPLADGSYAKNDFIAIPTLSELIKECGPTKIAPNLNTKDEKLVEHFFRLGVGDVWFADYEFYESTVINNETKLPIVGWGSTPEEAVAKLWIEINGYDFKK